MSKTDDQQYEQIGDIVSIYRRRGSRSWYAYYRLDGRPKRQSLKTRHHGKARRFALELENKLLSGREVRAPKAPLIADAVEEYLASLGGKQRSGKTVAKYRHCFKLVKQVASELGVTRLHQLNHRFIDAFCNKRVEEGAQPKTVKNDVVTIRQLVNFALRRGLLVEDPLKNLELPKAPYNEQPHWEPEQVELILAGASPQYRPYFTFLWLTGARASEAVWLTWNDVDFDKGAVHIRAKPGWRPKSGDARVIPMSDPLRAMLSGQPRQWPWVFTAKPSSKCPQPGRQISSRRALSHLKTVLRRLSLPGKLHTFRHSFISHAAMSNLSESLIRRWVGHVDARIMRTYMHVADQSSQRAMKQLFAGECQQKSGNQATP